MKRRKEPGTELTAQEIRFCQEYITDFDGFAAAERAGFVDKNRHCKSVRANNLLTRSDIQEYLKELKHDQAVRTRITADKVLTELYNLMMVDAKDIIAPDGTMINLHNIPPEVRRAISSIDVEETFEGTGKDRVWTGYIKKVRFWDKTKAVEMLAKHKALLSDKLIVDDRRALHDEVTRAITENDATPK